MSRCTTVLMVLVVMLGQRPAMFDINVIYVSACPLRTFGENCTSVCHCADGTGCDSVTGACFVGCETGWTGDSCSVQLGKHGTKYAVS